MLKKTCIVAATVAGLLTAGGSAFASSCSSHHIGTSCKPFVGDDAPFINVSDLNISDIDVSVLDLVGGYDRDCCSSTMSQHGLF